MLKQKILEGTIETKFDLPPKSPKSQKAESAVVFLFGQIHNTLGFTEIQFSSGFPDCTAIWNGVKVRIEFEYDNGDFRMDHNSKDKPTNLIIVCWENRWRSCPYPVLELKKVYMD